MLFDTRSATDSTVPVSLQDTDGNETDYFSLKDESKSISSSPTKPDIPNIIITPPYDEQPLATQGHLGNLRGANMIPLSVSTIYSTSAPPMLAPTEYFLDENFLIPPYPENFLDQRRYRRAKEYRELKEWLVEFLNSKGHQFPTKLRCRVMEIYGITNYDLAPATIAKFKDKDEAQDEGVSLNYGESFEEVEGEKSDEKLLRILRAFFATQIQDVTPKIDPKTLLQGFTTDREIQKKYPSMALSLPMAKSRSVPNFHINTNQSYKTSQKSSIPGLPPRSPLHRAALTRPSTPKSRSIMPPVVELQALKFVDLKSGFKEANLSPVEKEARANRSRIMEGTFGAVREAMGGRPRTKRRSSLMY